METENKFVYLLSESPRKERLYSMFRRRRHPSCNSIIIQSVVFIIFLCLLDGISGQTPLIRLPSNSLIKYTAYRDVSILHFQVPPDTRTVYYTFRAHEEFKSAFPNRCEPRNITLHIKARSYPVVSPENIPFPQHFFNENQREKIYTLQFRSDSAEQKLTVDGPLPGSWFAIAFISWTDPKRDRIEQQGLTVSCETILTSDMSVQGTHPTILIDESVHEYLLLESQMEPFSYKFFASTGVVSAVLIVTVQELCEWCPPMTVLISPEAMPNAENYLEKLEIPSNETQTVTMEFFTMENVWHYVDVGFKLEELNALPIDDNQTRSNAFHVKYSIRLKLVFENQTNEDSNLPQIVYNSYPLMRQTYREFFMYDFDLLPDLNNETPAYINISASNPVQMKVTIGDTYDIGGTLSFAVAFFSGSKTDYGEALTIHHNAVAEKLTDNTLKQSRNMTLIVCMRVGISGIPTWPNKCVYGRLTYPPVIIINTTSEQFSTGLVHVPYPETGQWIISMGLFCDNTVSMSNDSQQLNQILDSEKSRIFILENANLLEEMLHPFCECFAIRKAVKNCILDETKHCLFVQMNDTLVEEVKNCMLSKDCVKNHQSVLKRHENFQHYYQSSRSLKTGVVTVDGEETCNTRLVFTIASNPCVAGRCGQYGRCYHYMSGGVVYSTCLCLKGYRGWDCTEDSEVPDSWTILMASLFLTLSNLLFLPSIYFAVIRKYYTEAVIYFFAMFFSTFYHACDSGEDEFSFCLVKISVLQFSDFYCGLLAIWVTLVAMANLKPNMVSILHMLGAIILAFGTELNKQSLWVFLTPAITGLCIISSSWGFRCYRTRKWFPSRKYYSVYLPIGAVLVMIGLVCYAFLQTKQNYHVVHSVWHMVMALSLLCLLPSQNSFIPKS